MPDSLLDLPLWILAAIPACVLFGYTIFGATGFGSAIIAVPLLSHGLPLTVSVPLMSSLDLFAATGTALRNRRQVAWPEFRLLAPAAVIGIALGATLLLNIPARPALLALGVFVSVYGAYVLSGARRLRSAPGWLAWPTGIAGGVFSALFGTGGPIYVVFLSARIEDKGRLRATASLMVTLSVWLRISVFAVTGVLSHAPLLLLVAAMLPVMALGLVLGQRLHRRLSSAGVLRLIAALLLVNGVTLLARAAS
jgi:uncharacterized membrane protein YfcA